MSDPRRLPTELLWQDDGHVSDVVVDSLADGQDEIVDASAREHVDVCELCAGRLGEAVLMAMSVGEAMERAVGVRAKPWPIPVVAVLAAVVLAALGTLPTLADLAARVAELSRAVVSVLPNLTRAALVLGRTGELSSQLAYMSLFAIATLLAGGLLVARKLPRETPLRGDVR